MRPLFPILVLFTLLFAIPTFATSYVQNVAVNNSAYQYWCYNITTNTLEGITSLPCTNNEDLLINFNISKLEAWSLNESFVSIIGDVSSDCTGSISMYAADVNDLDLTNAGGLSPAPLPYQAVCLKTKEGYKAIASAFAYNGTDFNMTVQWNDEGNYYFNYTTRRDATVYDIPIFFPALPASAYHYNAIDIDNGLNYGNQPIMTSDEIDLVDYMYANPYTVQFGATNQPNGKISAYNPVQDCYDIIYSGYAKNAQTGLAYFTDDSYCIKTSEDMLYSVQRVGYRYFTPPIHLHVIKESYPMFSSQLMPVTDTGDLWIRTGSFDADSARDNTYGFTSTPYIISPIGNKSYTFRFNSTYGYVSMSGSQLNNPVGAKSTSLPIYEYTDANTLSTFDCSAYEPYVLMNSLTVRGINPSEHSIVCYNLSTANNPELFSAVKFINTTNVRGSSGTEFDAYVAVYNNMLLVFSGFQTLPVEIFAKQNNVTFSWHTRYPMTTELRMQYFDAGNSQWSSWVLSQNLTAGLNTSHSISIDSSYFTQPTSYHAQLAGTDVNLTSYASVIYSFSVNEVLSGTLANALSRFTEGIILFPVDNVTGFPIDAGTCYLDTSGYIEGVPPNRLLMTWMNISVTARYYPFYMGNHTYGLHEVGCKADGYIPRNYTINVNSNPYVEFVKINPMTRCSIEVITSLEERCIQEMNSTHFGELWGCIYDSNFYLENLQKYGAWKGYLCPDEAAANRSGIPLYNNTSTPSKTGSGTTDTLCYGVNKLLNTTCNQSLWFVGLMLSLVIMGGLGFVTRSGLVSVSSGLVSILAFTGIGWIPIWVGIVLVVLTALLIAKFVSNSVMPQGSGD